MTADSPIKDHGAERRLFLVRTSVVAAAMALLVGVLVARLVWLQVLQHEYYSLRSDDNRTRVEVVPPVRGLIYDRNGVVLADNLPAYRLVVIPEEVDDIHAALARLNDVVEIRAIDRERYFERVAQQPDFRAVAIRLNLSQREVARFEVNRLKFPAMEIRAGLTRHYPLGKVAAHLIGYVGSITKAELMFVSDKRYRGSSHVGKTGVEDSYESLLHGYPGYRVVETNAMGRSLRELEFSPPTAGNSLYLTIDAQLQIAAFRALGDYAGAVVALNPETGGVLALVSKPSFDPGLFVDGISHEAYNALLHDRNEPLFNRALQGQYPPGSTIKPVMAIAALQENAVNPNEQVWCPGYITLPGGDRRWRDWKRSGHGWLNLTEAIFRSSDVYFYKLGMALGIDAMHHWGTVFGLGRPTGIDLPGENDGLMPSRSWKRGARGMPWFPGETLNTVIGQGYMTATPLQLAQFTATIAQRGQRERPHVLLAYDTPGSAGLTAPESNPLPPIDLNNPSDWALVVNAMEKVVHGERGTAHYYVGGDLPYRMAGKSGTAQVRALAQGEVAPDTEDVALHKRDHALFIAFAPADDPKIAVAVVVEHGGGGSSTAGPIAREVIDAYLLETRVVSNEESP